jgi:hypothetical protein
VRAAGFGGKDMPRNSPVALLVLAVVLSVAAAGVCVRAAWIDRDAIQTDVFPWNNGSVSGFAFDGHALWITRDGAPFIHRVDPDSGAITRTIRFVTGDTGGSAWDGRTLWQIAYLDRAVYAVDVERSVATRAFETPGTGLCAGMTFDGRYLWIANFEDARIYRVDPTAGGRIVDSIAGQLETTGLAWDGRSLWTGLLVGTKTHDEETPYTGFVQQLAGTSLPPRQVWPVPGVGPGASDWLPGMAEATKFWWYDGFHKRVVVMRRREPHLGAAAMLTAFAALAAATASVAMAWATARGRMLVAAPRASLLLPSDVDSIR